METQETITNVNILPLNQYFVYKDILLLLGCWDFFLQGSRLLI